MRKFTDVINGVTPLSQALDELQHLQENPK